MVRQAEAGARQFLDPAVLARLGSLELKARVVVEGYLQGLHRSPFRGLSVEFAEYRPYLHGDDPRSIDWKIYARSDRTYVKRFEQETNLPCHLLLDVSGSMAYGSAGLTKLDYGTYLCAALAWLLNAQRDAVGLMAFDAEVVAHVPASARPGHLRTLLGALDRLRPGARSDLSKPITQLAEAITRRGLVVLVSDLLDDPEAVVAGLRHLRFRGMEVVVFHVIDPAERTFPFERSTRFRDLETGTQVLTSPAAVREEYLRQFEAARARFEEGARTYGIDYCPLDTSTPLEFALVAYFAARRRALV
jgi:uncharacterized protein (DUF58 family)